MKLLVLASGFVSAVRKGPRVHCEISQCARVKSTWYSTQWSWPLSAFSADHLGGAMEPLGLHCQEVFRLHNGRTVRQDE